jgi:hypothetical protein
VFLLPYAVLLADRSPTMDEVQLLSNTHSLDLGRPPEYATGLVLAVVVIGLASKICDIRETRVLLVISLALSVFVVFNQQAITGRSLQPIHYQVFIGNYIAALAFTLTAGMLFPLKKILRSKLIPAVAIAVSLIAVSWGFVECFYTVRVLDEVNVLRDEAFPVGKRLTELAAGDAQAHSEVILPFEIAVGDDLPTIAPQGVLWARHQHVFAGVTWQENKERYYQYLYYTGVDPEQLAASMRSGHDFVSIIALFGWGRHTDRLSADFKPLTFGELDHEAQLYADYIQNFDPHAVSNRPLDFAVVRSDSDPDWSNVDRWYTRSEPESIGPFDLYKLKLRQ